MRPVRNISWRRGSLALTAVALLAAASPALAQSPEGDWRQTVFLYGMGAMIEGDAQVGNLQVDVDMNLSDFFDNLKFGAMAAYRIEDDEWSFSGDVTYMNLGASKTTQQGRASAGTRHRAGHGHGDRGPPRRAASGGAALARVFRRFGGPAGQAAAAGPDGEPRRRLDRPADRAQLRDSGGQPVALHAARRRRRLRFRLRSHLACVDQVHATSSRSGSAGTSATGPSPTTTRKGRAATTRTTTWSSTGRAPASRSRSEVYYHESPFSTGAARRRPVALRDRAGRAGAGGRGRRDRPRDAAVEPGRGADQRAAAAQLRPGHRPGRRRRPLAAQRAAGHPVRA